jgi:hypothetical protein
MFFPSGHIHGFDQVRAGHILIYIGYIWHLLGVPQI